MRRYPLQALVDATGLTEAALGREVGLSGTSLKKARELGLVDAAADRCAVRLGLLPWQVWPEWLEALNRPCSADGCNERFLPPERAPHALYCSRRCAQREKVRRYRATPRGAEANRRHRRAYYAENRAYELEQKRLERVARKEAA